MNFCATCGRRRTGDTRFCDGCGTEFRAAETTAAGTPLADQPAAEFPQGAEATPSAAALPASAQADEATRWDPPAEAARLETAPAGWTPADATRAERQPDATRVDTQGSAPGPFPPAPAAPPEPDPFASWFAADPPEGTAPPRDAPAGTWQQPAGQWESADTVYAAPGQRAPAYPPPQPPPPYGGQQAPPPGGQPSSAGRRVAFIIVVVLVMLAAGGGAYALVSRSNQHNAAQPPAPTGTARSSASASAQASASASASPSTSASASPTASAAASTSAAPGVVSLGPGVASNPAEPAVETTLTDYFQGINTHNYAEYASSLDAQQRAAEPESAFNSGYSSTSDSGMKLTVLASDGDGDGGLAATVTFTSHQAAGTGVDGSSCNDWSLTFYLVKQGAGYLKGAAPSGYQPTYSDC